MTAARQERKSPHGRAVLAAPVLVLGLVLGLAATPGGAATTERVVINRYTGVAIDGFDPVAYFVDAKPIRGRAEFELRSGGAAWRFQNEGNRSAFAAAPEVYMPQFGGYDPMSLARGAAAPGDPALWLIARQRLYLFYSVEERAAFARDPDAAIDAAERQWPKVRETLVRD